MFRFVLRTDWTPSQPGSMLRNNISSWKWLLDSVHWTVLDIAMRMSRSELVIFLSYIPRVLDLGWNMWYYLPHCHILEVHSVLYNHLCFSPSRYLLNFVMSNSIFWSLLHDLHFKHMSYHHQHSMPFFNIIWPCLFHILFFYLMTRVR